MSSVPVVLNADDGEVPYPNGVYPLNWDSNDQDKGNNAGIIDSSMQSDIEEEKIYPDFHVWKQTEKDDQIMENHLQKGYVEPQFVKYEDQSGMHLLSSLFDNESNKDNNLINQSRLNIMGQVFIDAMHQRKIFNGIKSNSVYKPPARVTLTEHKKETWLKKLANPNIPLKELSRAIPHGLRNRFLLEQCLFHNIPIHRAIWLIKCISTSEQRQLRRKNNNISTTLNVNKWIVEWTEQITAFFESIIESCFTQHSEKRNWRPRVNYSIELIVNLYTENLMNRTTFLTWIVRYTSSTVNKINSISDIRPLLIHHTIIKMFWFKIIKYDYLTKELSESMLLLLFHSSQFKKNTKFDSIVNRLVKIFQEMIKYLFYFNSDIFIIPNNWNRFKPFLRKLLDMDLPPVSEQFKLISYRNNSLNNDEFDRPLTSNVNTRLVNSTFSPISPSPSFIPNLTSSSHSLNTPSVPILKSMLNSKTSEGLVYDKISLVLNKLNNFQDESIQSLSKIIFEDNSDYWKNYLHFIFQWGIRNNFTKDINFQRITLICSVLQFKISDLIQTKPKKFKQFKADLENKVVDFIFLMSEILNYNNVRTKDGNNYDIISFLNLINRLSNIKLFIISSYLRRLIASGVIYLSEPDRSCYIHILILNQLPKKEDTNLKSILGRLMDSINWRIVDNDIDYSSLGNLQILDTLYSKDDDYSSLSLLHMKDFFFCYNDPTQQNKHFETGEAVIKRFENIIGSSKTKEIYITENKLSIIYELFKLHQIGLSRFLTILLEVLNSEDRLINIDNRCIILLIQMVVINKNLLESTIYNMKWSMWEYSIVLIKRMFEKNSKYEISKCIQKANIPTLIYIENFNDIVSSDMEERDEFFITKEEMNIIEVPIYEKLINTFEFSHFMMICLMRFINVVKTGENYSKIGIIIKYLKSLQKWKELEFRKYLFDYLKRSVKSTFQIEYESNLKIIQQLLIYKFVDISDIIIIFETEKEDPGIFDNSFDEVKLFYDLFFDNGQFANTSIGIRIDKDSSATEVETVENYSIISENNNEYVIGNKSYEIFIFKYLKFQYIMNNCEKYHQIFTRICTSNYINEINTGSIELNNMSMSMNMNMNINMNMNLNLDLTNSNTDTPSLNVGVETPQDIKVVNEVLNENPININKEVRFVNKEVISRFWEFATNKSKLFIKYFHILKDIDMINHENFNKFIFNDILNDEIVHDIINEITIVNELDYFNLPILQFYFDYYLRVQMKNERANGVFYNTLIENIMREGHKKYGNQYDKLIGELFVYVPIKCKENILSGCEEMYLNSENFPKLLIDNGIDVTKLLSCILWSVCKQNDYSDDEVEKLENEEQKQSITVNVNGIDKEVDGMNKIPILGINGKTEIFKSPENDMINIPLNKKEKVLKLSDGLVFSLTSVLDKLIHIFNGIAYGKRKRQYNLGISKDLEFGIKMIARIILLHREFLVELILKRSVNLQKDVLINNLMKMFNHKVIQKNPKLKNLLYDVLISIKVSISELITERNEQVQMKMSNSINNNNNNNNNNNLVNSTNNASLSGLSSVNKPSNASSPGLWINRGNSSAPTPNNNNNKSMNMNNAQQASRYTSIANILNVKPPTLNNNLRSLLTMFDWTDTIPEKEHEYYIIQQSWNEQIDKDSIAVKFTERPFEQIESTGDTKNSSINIQLFGATIKRCNPE